MGINVNICRHFETVTIQVTFSEKGTKITHQTHLQKFEILHFSDNISRITIIKIFFPFRKVYHINLKGKYHYGIDSIVFQCFQLFRCEFVPFSESHLYFLFISSTNQNVKINKSVPPSSKTPLHSSGTYLKVFDILNGC